MPTNAATYATKTGQRRGTTFCYSAEHSGGVTAGATGRPRLACVRGVCCRSPWAEASSSAAQRVDALDVAEHAVTPRAVRPELREPRLVRGGHTVRHALLDVGEGRPRRRLGPHGLHE